MTNQRGNENLERLLRRYCSEAGEPLQDVCLHALAGGRRTRASLLLRASQRTDIVAVQAACALELMHAATLLQDDIFDHSVQRRGRKAAHLQFGEAQTVLASDWLLLRSLEVAAEIHPGFLKQLACAARTMAATVAKELRPPSPLSYAAAELYIDEICQGKTAALFAASLYAGALLNPATDPGDAATWGAVGSRIGCTYQLLDDCLDVYAPACALDKSTGVDLQQGRLTMPLLTALQTLRPGEHRISIDRIMRASLTEGEIEQLERAIESETVRTRLKDQVVKEIRLIGRSGTLALIPDDAITPALKDMEEKCRLCFGEAGAPAVISVRPVRQEHAA